MNKTFEEDYIGEVDGEKVLDMLPEGPEPEEETGKAYGTVRNGSVPFLELRYARSQNDFLSYSFLSRMTQTEGTFLTLFMTDGAILLEGEGMELLARKLQYQKVRFIQEHSKKWPASGPDGVRVDRISVLGDDAG